MESGFDSRHRSHASNTASVPAMPWWGSRADCAWGLGSIPGIGPRTGLCMAKHAAQRRHQGASRRTAGDDGRHTIQRTHITPHILISYSPHGTAYFLCTLHQFNGIFTSAYSPTDANRSNGQRNQPEPSALLPARSSELLAGCDELMGRTHITHTSHASRLLSSSLSHHLLPPRSRN